MKKQWVSNGRWFLAALAAMLGPLASLSPVTAGHINCGAILGPGGTFTLDSDVGPCPEPPHSVVITVNSATLNLNGFTISGNAVLLTGQHCVELIGARATLQGPGTIKACERGVVVKGGGAHLVRQVTAEMNTGNGIILVSNNNRLTNNTSRSNTFVGIAIAIGSQRNELTGNTASSSGVYGFQIVGSANRLMNNTATDHGEDGIVVWEGATNNVLRGNKGQRNSGFDLADDNVNCDQNIWRGNTGTRNQPCIR
jgi:parallel beta-helix repeat protein